jgi:hypothetical protein
MKDEKRISAGRVGVASLGGYKAPSISDNERAALGKVRHPTAPLEVDALERELQQQRDELAEMTRLLAEEPEQFDSYFDQVAETGEVKQGKTTKVTAKQIPAKKTPARKAIARKKPARSGNPAKKAAAKAIAPVEPQLAPGQTISVPIVPVPPQRPGAETVEQEE